MMEEVKVGDLVSWKSKKKTYYTVSSIDGGIATLTPKRSKKTVTAPVEELNVWPAYVFTASEWKEFMLLEKPFDISRIVPEYNFEVEEPFKLYYDDFLKLLINLQNLLEIGDDFTLKDWWTYYYKAVSDEKVWPESGFIKVYTNPNPPWPGTISEDMVFEKAMEEMEKYFCNDITYKPVRERWFDVPVKKHVPIDYGYDLDVSDLVKEAQSVVDNRNKSLEEFYFTHKQKVYFLETWNEEHMLKSGDEVLYGVFRRITEELCEINDYTGLKVKAYACYGGNEVYPCDWVASRDCLLKLLEHDDGGYAANTLGYIYYYGRDTGTPDYEKAFKYFSIGSMYGLFESMYKIADMYYNGLYVDKNVFLAQITYGRLYDETIRYMYGGNTHSKFADLAIRMGKVFDNDSEPLLDYSRAFKYFLQADFALKLRAPDNYFGDSKLRSSVKESLSRLEPLLPFKTTGSKTAVNTIVSLLEESAEKGTRFVAGYHKLMENHYIMTFKVEREPGQSPVKLFITVPGLGFCGYLDCLSLEAKEVNYFHADNYDALSEFNFFIFDEIQNDKEFYLSGKKVAVVSSERFEIMRSSLLYGNDHNCALVATEGSSPTLCIADIPVEIGDFVNVSFKGKKSEQCVVDLFKRNDTDFAKPVDGYPHIVSKCD